MKRFLLYTLLIICALPGMADGWEYRDGKTAGIESNALYLSGDYDAPTTLGMFIGKNSQGRWMVLCALFGECEIHDFQPSQQYIVVAFPDGREKFEVKPIEMEGKKFQYVMVGNERKLLKRLQDVEWFNVSLPVYGYGVQMFTFSAYGYPLVLPE